MLALTSNNFLIPKFPRKKPNYISNKSSSPSLQENNFPPIKVGKRVVLVRHGQSTWNEQGRIQGSSNFSILTQKGETQADISRQMLLNDTFDVCFASPLARSRRTAEVIWDTRKQEIITDFDLREIDLYSFQGLLKHQGKEKFGEAYIKWQKDAPNFNIDGHYPVRELWDRARNCWTKILDHEGESVLVVAHNAINQALVATAIGIFSITPFLLKCFLCQLGLGTEYFRNLIQSNCGVTVLEFSPQAEEESPHVCLNRLNQTPKSPIAAISSGGRKSSKRIILACHGSMQRSIEPIPSGTVQGGTCYWGCLPTKQKGKEMEGNWDLITRSPEEFASMLTDCENSMGHSATASQALANAIELYH
ncbi:hypothetical protein IFM89_002099 [Coptis chinensis]|uniref:2-carboxy-D-arabinitol-1-phosphatase n=1 Tax=Coptis chinensis TaxID=261450 RepID=A0A835LGP9_9MAGN|nr:hypothetical protein IFM89_002099 [Coptis chinensis]